MRKSVGKVRTPGAPAADVTLFIDGRSAARLFPDEDITKTTDPAKLDFVIAQVVRLLKKLRSGR